MKNVILVSAVLTLLASCTLMPENSMTPDTMQKPETKIDSTMMMDDKKMMDDDMMKKDTMISGSMEKPMMDDKMEAKTDDKMMTGSDMMKKEDDIMDKSIMMNDKMEDAMDEKKMMNDSMMKKDTEAMVKPTGYMAYDAAQVDAALASGQKVALFFHATWCPSCKALDKAISADTLPSDAVIFKVDYDTSIDLKKKYRVVGQHTTVILNADGTEKSKKLGARTVAEVLN